MQFKPSSRYLAVTLLELMVVVLIISILASIATGVYTGETNRARIAAAHALIHNLEIAITRYEIDTGSLPPSGTGVLPLTPLDPVNPTNNTRFNGSGFLHNVLVHSMSGITSASAQWKGPYITLQASQIQSRTGLTAGPGTIDIIDPWGSPILYFNNTEYNVNTADYYGGTKMFTSSPAPDGANPALPAPNPFVAEIYYNPRTFQLISYGPDATTLIPAGGISYAGAAADDINNFGY